MMHLDDQTVAKRFYDALVTHTQAQPRTQQSQEYRMGASDLGLCRSFIKHLINQVPYDEDKMKDPKWSAFVGSAVGDRLEQAYLHSYPGTLVQAEFETTFPSGRVVPGHTDVVDVELNAVFDIKSKDGLEMVKAGGPSRPNRYQIATYLRGLVQAGILKEGARAFLVYVDRSGKDPMPHVVEVVVDDALITEIDEFVGDGIYAAVNGVEAPKDQPWNFCESYCLTGDTEVVTRSGIVPISSLGGSVARLLVPNTKGNGLLWHGSWVEVPVRYYGSRLVRTITLKRGKARKTVRATPDHKWFVGRWNGQWRDERVVDTSDLAPGDMLRDIRANRGHPTIVPAAIAHGFVYGDGSRKNVSIYPNSGDKHQMGRFFSGCHVTQAADGTSTYSGIPRLWKDAPSFEESNGYLLSFLAGYFAADGSISKSGQASISSASRESIELVRSLCAIAGVGYGPVSTQTRLGYGAEETSLYRVTLNTNDLPSWFWVRDSQRARVVFHQDARMRRWTVVSVEDHGEVEDVYCAEVPEVEAFALSDGLLTHNCAFFRSCRGKETYAEGIIEDEEAAVALKMFLEARETAKNAESRKKMAGEVLGRYSGVIVADDGPYEVSQTLVAGGSRVNYVTKDSSRLNVRKK